MTNFEKRAMKSYCNIQEANRDPKTISLDEIASSKHGLRGWSQYNKNGFQDSTKKKNSDNNNMQGMHGQYQFFFRFFRFFHFFYLLSLFSLVCNFASGNHVIHLISARILFVLLPMHIQLVFGQHNNHPLTQNYYNIKYYLQTERPSLVPHVQSTSKQRSCMRRMVPAKSVGHTR